jgi:hypothetical protein
MNFLSSTLFFRTTPNSDAFIRFRFKNLSRRTTGGAPKFHQKGWGKISIGTNLNPCGKTAESAPTKKCFSRFSRS